MIFWDTSALVRAYDESEPGHARAAGMLQRERASAGSLFLLPEFAGALARRKARNESGRAALLLRVTEDLAHFHLVPVDPPQVDHALRLIVEHSLRGPDALHLAAALGLAAEIRRGFRFCSSDRDQLRAAAQEGLRTICL